MIIVSAINGDQLECDKDDVTEAVWGVLADHTAHPSPLCFLSVGGFMVLGEGQCAYSIRFTNNEPVLYKDGKRVTLPWRLGLIHESMGGGDVSA